MVVVLASDGVVPGVFVGVGHGDGGGWLFCFCLSLCWRSCVATVVLLLLWYGVM